MRMVSQIPRYVLKQIAKNHDSHVKDRNFNAPVQQVIGEITEKTNTPGVGGTICLGAVYNKRSFLPVAHHLWVECPLNKFPYFDIGDVMVAHGKVHTYGRGDRVGLHEVHVRKAHDDEAIEYYTTLERLTPSLFSI